MTETETQVQVCKDSEALAQHACVTLVAKIQRHHAEKSGPFVLALSGGSTPKRLYQLLSELAPGKVDWSRVLLIWGDERNVDPEDEQSNFRMVRENLLDSVGIPEENVLAVPNPGADAEQAAAQYEDLLREHIGNSADGSESPTIHCALLGMGDDVHTASLFPETAALAESKRWVVGNWVAKLDCWRITLSAPTLNNADCVLFLIAGRAKEHALHLLWHGERNPNLYPSQLIQPVEGELVFMVDEPALGENRPPENAVLEFIS